MLSFLENSKKKSCAWFVQEMSMWAASLVVFFECLTFSLAPPSSDTGVQLAMTPILWEIKNRDSRS